MIQAPSVAFALDEETPVGAPARGDRQREHVSLRGTTRGLEILITGAPSTASLGERLAELLAEAPSFFAGSDARVVFENPLPPGALACLEEVATRFELRLVEISPLAIKRRRTEPARAMRPDEVALADLAEGTGRFTDETLAQLAVPDVPPPSQATATGAPIPEAPPSPSSPVVSPSGSAPSGSAPSGSARSGSAPTAIPTSPTAASTGSAPAAIATTTSAPTAAPSASTGSAPTASASTASASTASASTASASTASASTTSASTTSASTGSASTSNASTTSASATSASTGSAPSAIPSTASAPTAAPCEPIARATAKSAAIAATSATSATSATGAMIGSAPIAVPIGEAIPPGARLVIGPVRSGMIVDHPGHLVVVGDVNPGAEVRAEGSIIVLGRLRGVAHAAIGRDRGFIVALSLQPQQLRIARMVARADDADRPNDGAEIAYAAGETIVVERFLGRLPSGLAASM